MQGDTEAEPIHQIAVYRYQEQWREPIQGVLGRHGCTYEEAHDHWTITFPKGTQRQELWPKKGRRYRIDLPDGYHLLEEAGSETQEQRWSRLWFPLNDFPAAPPVKNVGGQHIEPL